MKPISRKSYRIWTAVNVLLAITGMLVIWNTPCFNKFNITPTTEIIETIIGVYFWFVVLTTLLFGPLLVGIYNSIVEDKNDKQTETDNETNI